MPEKKPVRVDGYVWVNKSNLSMVQLHNLRRDLTLQPKSTSEYNKGLPEPLPLFAETNYEFGMPRAWYKRMSAPNSPRVLAVSDGEPMSDECMAGGFTGALTGTERFDEQTKAVAEILRLLKTGEEEDGFGGTLLNAGCAFGKTVAAGRIAMGLGVRTNIIVNKEFFIHQWTERLEEFFPGAKIGVCRQGRCEWDGYDFTISLVHSLVAREYEPEFYSAFGFIVTDEVHRIGSASWSQVIPKFNARHRLGLSATLRRKDGTEAVFYDHIGPVGYKAITEGLDFMVSRVDVEFELQPIRRWRKIVPVGELTSGDIETQIAVDPTTNFAIVSSALAAVKNGRKVFIVSTRTEQLFQIEQMLLEWIGSDPDKVFTIGWVTGSVFVKDGDGKRYKHRVKRKNRSVEVWKMRKPTRLELDHADTCQVMLATKQMIEEGYDCPAIDAQYLGMPMSDVEQTVGRARRPCLPSPSKCKRLCHWRAGVCQGKPKPVIKDFVHSSVPRLESRWKRRATFYRSKGVKIP